MVRITRDMAGNFLINYQGLNDFGADGLQGAKDHMSKVRCIQFDPLDVVGRNPDLVLQSRVRDYKPQILQDMLYKDRILIDGYDKVMSIIMTEDYPEMTRVREGATEELIRTLTYRSSLESLDILDEVREYIRDNGPQPAGNIDIGGKADAGSWGHKKLSSAALDYLFHTGQLGISNKQRSVKVYDLNENLLPPEILNAGDSFADERDFLKWYVMRRIGSIGIVWNRNTGAWLGQYIGNRELRTGIINELVDEGKLLPLEVEGSKETFYIRKEDEGLLGKDVDNEYTRFIAPLDNFIWDRDMIEELFGFRYSWEVYTPVEKRQYGYYVLPVLYRNRFIARFEPEKNDGSSPLKIKNWWWEPDAVITDEMVDSIRDAFIRFSDYLGVKMMRDSYWKKKLKEK